jgi:hypothetical protein
MQREYTDGELTALALEHNNIKKVSEMTGVPRTRITRLLAGPHRISVKTPPAGLSRFKELFIEADGVDARIRAYLSELPKESWIYEHVMRRGARVSVAEAAAARDRFKSIVVMPVPGTYLWARDEGMADAMRKELSA